MWAELQKLVVSGGWGHRCPSEPHVGVLRRGRAPRVRQNVARRPARTTLRPKYGSLTLRGDPGGSTLSCKQRVRPQLLLETIIRRDRIGRGAVRP